MLTGYIFGLLRLRFVLKSAQYFPWLFIFTFVARLGLMISLGFFTVFVIYLSLLAIGKEQDTGYKKPGLKFLDFYSTC